MKLDPKDLKMFEYLLWRAKDYSNEPKIKWFTKDIELLEAERMIAVCKTEMKEAVTIHESSGPPSTCVSCEG
jgi:hypothetical protein